MSRNIHVENLLTLQTFANPRWHVGLFDHGEKAELPSHRFVSIGPSSCLLAYLDAISRNISWLWDTRNFPACQFSILKSYRYYHEHCFGPVKFPKRRARIHSCGFLFQCLSSKKIPSSRHLFRFFDLWYSGKGEALDEGLANTTTMLTLSHRPA